GLQVGKGCEQDLDSLLHLAGSDDHVHVFRGPRLLSPAGQTIGTHQDETDLCVVQDADDVLRWDWLLHLITRQLGGLPQTPFVSLLNRHAAPLSSLTAGTAAGTPRRRRPTASRCPA